MKEEHKGNIILKFSLIRGKNTWEDIHRKSKDNINK
jgi:hypothetical protein